MIMRFILVVLLVFALCMPVVAKSQYGGLDSIKGKQTGFFHVEKIGKRWWCIDPSGSAFYAVGTDHVNYNVHWCEALGYAPYAVNIRKRYNNDESAWAKSSTDRLKDWGFNILGANNSPSTRDRGLAYMEFIGMGSAYSSKEYIVEKTTWTGFPDVFSPGFVTFCNETAQNACSKLKDSPWLFGWFLDNELEWFGKAYSPVGLANEAIMRPAQTYAKKALVDLLKQKYTDISAFNKSWGTSLASWDAALASLKWGESGNSKVMDDKAAYVRLCADKYFSITTGAIRKADPNHMILGCRFAGAAPGVVDIAGKYCDIFTINYYGTVDLDKLTPAKLVEDMTDYYKRSGRPLMVTEWSFPALDAGLPSTNGAGMRTKTQADKAKAFEVYQTAFFDMPFFVGSDYFMWVDEPALGIAKTFPENSNYGLVDLNDDPWPLFTQAVKRVNSKVYNIHSGKSTDVQILNAKTSNKGVALSVKNVGSVDCQTEIDVLIDGQKYTKTASLPAMKTVAVPFGASLKTGGHYVEAIADPNGLLDEVHRGNNKYSGLVFVKGKPATGGAVAVCIGPGTGNVCSFSIPVAEIAGKTGKIAGLTVQNSNGTPVPAVVFDFDRSGSISSTDELAFKANPAIGECLTYYVKLKLKGDGIVRLIKANEVASVDLDLGRLRVVKNTQTGAILDTIKLGDTQIGKFDIMMQEVSDTSFWQRADKLDKMLLWDGGDIKILQSTVSGAASTDPNTGPFAFRAEYRLRFQTGTQWFESAFVSVTNTDSRPWKLGRYFHYPTSNIGGSSDNDEPITGTTGVLGWMDKKIGSYYGTVAPASSGMETRFWNDENGGQHGDVFKTLDVEMSPGKTYAEKQHPVYLICADGDDSTNTLMNFEKQVNGKLKWQVFK